MAVKVQKSFSEGEYHYVYGEVYAPDIVDTDGESMSAQDIRKMAHDFIAGGRVKALDTEHNHQINGAEVVESFIARKGDPDFAEGSWVLGVRMKDGPLWESVKKGDINGFSVDALVNKVPSTKALPEYSIAMGTTYEPVDASPHTHAYFLQLDKTGHVQFGKTDVVQGHHHEIIGTVVTEKAAGHSHRFAVDQ